jgi:cephalosporin hydroxylase
MMRIPLGELRELLRFAKRLPAYVQGYKTELCWQASEASAGVGSKISPLQEFIEARRQGLGIWKWQHYLDVYHRHFDRFRGQPVRVLEIGLYSGGSLDMWRDYFGPQAQIYGVDIQPECRAYESEGVQIFIGDQGDRSFWRRFRHRVPILDIVIDDGGHLSEQQIVSFEELLPFLQPGGVYVCEDIHLAHNGFMSYMCGIAHRLNDMPPRDCPVEKGRGPVSGCTPFQSAVAAIHLYPFVAVVERNAVPVKEFRAPKHGSQWQPFLE